jgi:D-alanyl-D-alanine-carboxypeptidase/D-alanyl-D-alanine-endopeptidase
MGVLRVIGIVVLVLIVVVVAILLFARHRMNNVKDKGNLEASLDKQAQRSLAKGRAYGIVIGVYKDGRSFTKGYGTLVKGEGVPPDGSSIFELASTSKLFTTTLLQILVDRGVLRLEDKIADLLREQVAVHSSAANTTLRQLATHTSGFPSLPQSFLEKMTDETNPYKDLTTGDLYDYLKTCDGKKPEGRFEYSNFGMGLLGHILAVKAGGNYEEAVQRELLRPIGMTQTFVTIDSSAASRIAQGYDASGNPTPVWTDTVLTGAGSFLSSASDMLLFIRANVDKTHPLYPTLAKTHVQQPGCDGGLGWMLPESTDKFMGNKAVVWHNGMAGGYASYIAVDTASGAGVIVLTNKSVDITSLGALLMRMVNTQSWKEDERRLPTRE